MTRKQMIESENSICIHNCGDISVEHKGNWYEYDSFTNRYYAIVEPCGFHSKLEKEGGMAKKRISKKAFEEIRQAVEDILKSIAEPEAKAETPEPTQVTTEPSIETIIEEAPETEQETETSESTPVTTEPEVPTKTQNTNDKPQITWEEYLEKRKKEIKAMKISDLTDNGLIDGYLSISMSAFTHLFDKFDKRQIVSEMIKRKLYLQELHGIIQSNLEIARCDAKLYKCLSGENAFYRDYLYIVSKWENLLNEVIKATNEQESSPSDTQTMLTQVV